MLISGPRVDWLIHILTTEFHSLYWLDQYSLETGYFENQQDISFSSNAWYHALHIPDVDVILDEQNLHLAKVLSQNDRSLVYTVWNPGSEFSFCDCSWSRVGNLCKHIIKVATFYRSRQVARPSLSAQVYKQALLTLLHNPPDDPLVIWTIPFYMWPVCNRTLRPWKTCPTVDQMAENSLPLQHIQ